MELFALFEIMEEHSVLDRPGHLHYLSQYEFSLSVRTCLLEELVQQLVPVLGEGFDSGVVVIASVFEVLLDELNVVIARKTLAHEVLAALQF